MHTRRDILQLLGASAGAGLLASALPAFAAAPATGASSATGRFVSKRPPRAQRRFVSKAVEQQ
ncbi:metal-independent alpha-mannosidase, partial [Xanthomonas perforans]|nr:metal-independent alpha-mannosidase [Xanthomonas perforans]